MQSRQNLAIIALTLQGRQLFIISALNSAISEQNTIRYRAIRKMDEKRVVKQGCDRKIYKSIGLVPIPSIS
jgi:hypothetical protein